ncbi:MAG: purine-nucleoside phosphorylase [Ruminococcus sp.]|nr:purine-nucleoside phosphorylase [Ruminococcus sp.]
MSENVYEKLERAYQSIRKKTDFVPEIALVLGSGLGAFADERVKVEATVSYTDIEGFPVSTVPGHKGRFVFGTVGGVKVAVMQGRVHYYEGYPMTDVVMPARLLAMMGAKVLFLTNASGGINKKFGAGDFMLIRDHIASFVPNPLIGANVEQLGTRFPDMSNIYDNKLCDIIKESAKDLGIELKEGVYAQLTGPSFETPAEIVMLGRLGADAVGMSTAVEAIAARHAGMKVCGISCVANQAAGISPTPLTHDEVQATADKAAPRFKALIADAIESISDYILTEPLKNA